jgi:serpin B
MRSHDEVLRRVKRRTEQYLAEKRKTVTTTAILGVLLLLAVGVAIPTIKSLGTERKPPKTIGPADLRVIDELSFELPQGEAKKQDGAYVFDNFSYEDYADYHIKLLAAGFIHKGMIYSDFYEKEGCLIVLSYKQETERLVIDWRARSKYAPEHGISEAEAAKIITPADTYSPIPVYAVDVTPEGFFEATDGQIFAFADYSFDDPQYSLDIYGKKSLHPSNEHYWLRAYFVRDGKAYRSDCGQIAAGDIDDDGENEVYLLNYGPLSGRYSFGIAVVDGEEEYKFWYAPEGISPGVELTKQEERIVLQNGTKYYHLIYEKAIKGYYIDGKFDRCEPAKVVAIDINGRKMIGYPVNDGYAVYVPLAGNEQLLTSSPEPDVSVTKFGTSSKDIMATFGIKARTNYRFNIDETIYSKATDFAVRLFKNCYDGKNTLVSPLSVSASAGLLSAGAEGNTLSQIETALGMTKDELESYFFTVMNAGEMQGKIDIANSLWLKNTYPLSLLDRHFFYSNADFYKAAVYSTPFDNTTAGDINKWVNEATGGKITEAAVSLSAGTSMYAVSAASLAAKWANGYVESAVTDGTFTNAAGETKNVTWMTSWERDYVFDKSWDGKQTYAEGFMKFYDGDKYAFLAILPSEGTSLDEYLSRLDSAKLQNMLKHRSAWYVNASIPAFEASSSASFDEIMRKMGIIDAFDKQTADFGGIVPDENSALYLGGMVHETALSVNAEGVKAEETKCEFVRENEIDDDPIYLRFDRPFLYMIIDTETMVPVLMGTVNDI